MHIAIDDTYGPIDVEPSKYVTGARRTYVAVEFPDDQVEHTRNSIKTHLGSLPRLLGTSPTEFHFTDIYNRKNAWRSCPVGENLRIFELYADIYRNYKWQVHIQTVDERTFSDHDLTTFGSVDDIDLGTKDGQALFLLLIKLKKALPPPPSHVVIRIDAGTSKPGKMFANAVFREWIDHYDGRFAASDKEPLLQIADFLAFCLNRSTHLQIKPQLTETDLWFLNLVGEMGIRSADIVQKSVNPNFLRNEIEAIHLDDRKQKGLE